MHIQTVSIGGPGRPRYVSRLVLPWPKTVIYNNWYSYFDLSHVLYAQVAQPDFAVVVGVLLYLVAW